MKLHISGPHHEVTLTRSRMVVDTAPHTSDEAEVSLELSPGDDEKLRSFYARVSFPVAEAEARAYRETTAQLIRDRDRLTLERDRYKASWEQAQGRAAEQRRQKDYYARELSILRSKLEELANE